MAVSEVQIEFTLHVLIQIISVNSSSDVIVDNIPDELATEIPRTMLLGFSNQSNVFEKLNKKKWKQQQVCETQKYTLLREDT